MAPTSKHARRVLVTGATGFVGSRLYGLLADRYAEVLGGTRSVSRAFNRWPDRRWTTVDVAQPSTLSSALEGTAVVYYLVHGMADHADYEDRERAAATAFVEAAARANVARIVYLGGVAPSGPLSTHLRSRLVTGEILRAGSVPCVELRAGMIVGSGSESWRMVRDISARLPFMILPRWLRTRSQPVSIRDVLAALVYAAEIPDDQVGCYSLPGAEVLSAKEIILRVSKLRGYRPRTIDVPFVSPRLSSYWIEWVTSADRRVARELVEGLRSDLVAMEPPFWTQMPDHKLQSFDDAARQAMTEDDASLSIAERTVERVVQIFTPRP